MKRRSLLRGLLGCVVASPFVTAKPRLTQEEHVAVVQAEIEAEQVQESSIVFDDTGTILVLNNKHVYQLSVPFDFTTARHVKELG